MVVAGERRLGAGGKRLGSMRAERKKRRHGAERNTALLVPEERTKKSEEGPDANGGYTRSHEDHMRA